MSLLGITKGTEIETQIAHFAELERQGAGMYQALARLANEQGFDELAENLQALAADEIRHAGLYTVLNGDIKPDIFSILRFAAEAEIGGEEKIKAFAQKARELGLDKAAKEIEAAAIEEGRHGVILKELIKKYENKKD
ncbi:ferritin family protein [Pelosinus sp. UFO1]|uniref:ferritin family protein n=1 Tax=Pelosinus sp. UFO1 TaxID=484770 RepID=UPI0004D13357|nr:ferritin family protein [Pelosinus sp. UFO1]AIF49944.1 Rubrerythrin [Pelosinus sp. UFO1]